MDGEGQKENKEHIVYTLDKGVRFIPAKRCLVTSSGTIAELSENSYRLLLLLLEGETDKSNLINQIWIEQRGSVSESSYYGLLYLLRKSFRQVELPETLIKTIPRKGVKYVGYVASQILDKTMISDAACQPYEHSVKLEDRALPLPVQEPTLSDRNTQASLKRRVNHWLYSRSWNIFVSVLAVLAVCWLTTLIFVFFFYSQSR